MACLDTSVILDLLGRGGAQRRQRIVQRLKELVGTGESLVTTRFTVAELWVGVERSRDPEREARSLSECLADLEVLEFDERAAHVFGQIVAHLQRHGQPVGDMDALIASVALVNGHSVVTRDVRHFNRIPALIVESY